MMAESLLCLMLKIASPCSLLHLQIMAVISKLLFFSCTNSTSFCREFPLVIPGPTGIWPGLKDNAVYKLRLSVVCPSEPVKSYADFLITTNSPPTVKFLKVRI